MRDLERPLNVIQGGARCVRVDKVAVFSIHKWCRRP